MTKNTRVALARMLWQALIGNARSYLALSNHTDSLGGKKSIHVFVPHLCVHLGHHCVNGHRTHVLAGTYTSVSVKDRVWVDISSEEFELRCPPGPNLPDYPSCGDISITEDGVRKLLLNLNPNNACGPDFWRWLQRNSPQPLLCFTASHTSPALCQRTGNRPTSHLFSKREKIQCSKLPSHLPYLRSLQTDGTHHHQPHHVPPWKEWDPLPRTTRLPTRTFMWDPAVRVCGRSDQRDREGKPGGHNCPWLLKGLRQSQPYPTYPQAATLRHQWTYQRLDKGLPHGQTTGCSGWGNKIWPSTCGIWRPTGFSPRTKPFSATHQWPPRRHQVKDPPICRRHHVQQDHHEEKRRASAARRSTLPNHLEGEVVHGVPPTEMLSAESLTEERQDRPCVWATWAEHRKCQHHQVPRGQHSGQHAMGIPYWLHH